MALDIIEARGLVRNMLVEIYQDDPLPTKYLQSMFKMKESRSKSISIEVRRFDEEVAVDVIRGTEGNRNSFGDFSMKKFIPPYYREYHDATELDFYDVMYASDEGPVTSSTMASWAEEIARRNRVLQNKIARRKELGCKQVLETGIVTLKNGDNIDFKRKVESIEDLNTAEGYWDTAIDPFISIERGCDFIRQKGKAQGGVLNLTLGSRAMNALLNNQFFKDKANLRRVDNVSLHKPTAASDGKVHGEITVGGDTVRLFSYKEFYKDPLTGNTLPYVSADKVVLTPEVPSFIMSHAAVPVTHRKENGTPHIEFSAGEFIFGDYVDSKLDKHIHDVKSAFLPIPVGVDQIWTAKVVA